MKYTSTQQFNRKNIKRPKLVIQKHTINLQNQHINITILKEGPYNMTSLALTASCPNIVCSLLVFEWMLLIMVEMIEVLKDGPGLMKTSN